MVRAHDLAGDARVLYGPLGQRPTPAEAGSGALWVDPADQTLYHVQSGNWVTISPAAGGGGGGGGAGTPVLYGPYTVEYTDIPHDGDKVTLWTPAVGDVLLRLFPDVATVVQWDHGTLYIGPNVDAVADTNVLAFAAAGGIGTGQHDAPRLDTVGDAIYGAATDAAGSVVTATAVVFHTTNPVHVQLGDTPGTDPTTGHVDLFALIARPVAP